MMALDSPALLGLYEIEYSDIEFYERCGGGAFGTVYRARLKSNENIVAVKKVLVLEKEAHVLNALRHKNIIQFFGAVLKPPNYCLVTEYAEGGSLYSFLATHQGDDMLDLPKVLNWATDIAEGMKYLHTGTPVTVIHRDLKSKNVVIAADNVCKICDFGASKFHGSTTKMSLAGTLPWMAPEVIQSLPTSAACDVWSYGVVLWELLTHQVPFKGIEGFQVAWLVVEKDERLVIPSTCPQILTRLMQACWEKEVRKRPDFENILKILLAMKSDDSLSDVCTIYLKHRSLWKNEIQTKLGRLKFMERNLDLRKKELQEWERRLEEKEQSLERQQYWQKLNTYDVNMWNESDVHFWIQQLETTSHQKDLCRYADLFKMHNISGRRLLLLSQDDMRQMGVVSIGHLIGLQTEIERLASQNKRMLEFPPLEMAIPDVSSKSEDLKADRLKLVLLFGNHVRRAATEQEHKWKMYVEVDENDNPAAFGCIKKVSFRCQESEQVIQQAPFVMERWNTGISEDTSVECVVTYQSMVKKPKQTKYKHKVRLDGSKVHQREVTLIMKKAKVKKSRLSTEKISPGIDHRYFLRVQTVAPSSGSSSPTPGTGMWAKVAASGPRASPVASPSPIRKHSLPTPKINKASKLAADPFQRTVSAPTGDAKLTKGSLRKKSVSAKILAKQSKRTKGVHLMPPINGDFSGDANGTNIEGASNTDTTSTNTASDVSLSLTSTVAHELSTLMVADANENRCLKPSISDSGIQLSPESYHHNPHCSPHPLQHHHQHGHGRWRKVSYSSSSPKRKYSGNSRSGTPNSQTRHRQPGRKQSNSSDRGSGSRNSLGVLTSNNLFHPLTHETKVNEFNEPPQPQPRPPQPLTTTFSSVVKSVTDVKKKVPCFSSICRQKKLSCSPVRHTKLDMDSPAAANSSEAESSPKTGINVQRTEDIKPSRGRGFRGIRGFNRSLVGRGRCFLNKNGTN